LSPLKPVLAAYDPSPLRALQKKSEKYKTFWRDMLFVGAMRGTTVLLGLVSLSHVAVSFTETIKASAPLFTVLFARLMLGEVTTTPVVLSLFPVMLGLVLCSATELSYDAIGFIAAVSNNCIDCIQNVFSKRLLSGSLSPVELQFYTSVAAATLQLPLMLLLSGNELWSARQLEPQLIGLLLLDGKFKNCFCLVGWCLVLGGGGVLLCSQKGRHPLCCWLWFSCCWLVSWWWLVGGQHVDLFLFISLFFRLWFACCCVGTGLSYHLQSVTAYFTMSLISPVSQSVANTLKRSLLIVISIWYFGNAINIWSAIGMITVVFGIVLYNITRRWQVEKTSRTDQNFGGAARNRKKSYSNKSKTGMLSENDLQAAFLSNYTSFIGKPNFEQQKKKTRLRGGSGNNSARQNKARVSGGEFEAAEQGGVNTIERRHTGGKHPTEKVHHRSSSSRGTMIV
jgi:drug/metabolite transporter (DMT)-like permease